MKWIKRTIITGVLLILPLAVSLWITGIIFRKVDGIFRPVLEKIVGYHIPGLGFILTFLLVLMVGLIGTNFFGKRIFSRFDKLMLRVPLIKVTYGTTKQLIDAFKLSKKMPFTEVVLIEFPRKEMYSLAFLMSDRKGEIQHTISQKLLCVFVSSTPNPTTGMLMYLPEEEIIHLHLSVEDALKMIISGGVISPNSASTTHLVEETSL